MCIRSVSNLLLIDVTSIFFTLPLNIPDVIALIKLFCVLFFPLVFIAVLSTANNYFSSGLFSITFKTNVAKSLT